MKDKMNRPSSGENPTTLVTGISRDLAIPSCSLTVEDLRRLYKILRNKAGEAADEQLKGLTRIPGQTEEQFMQFSKAVQSALDLVVRVQGTNGAWIGATTEVALSDEQVPPNISSVEFHSAFLFRNQFHIEPQNSFSLTLDFRRTSILDLTNLSSSPALNNSAAVISGQNVTWVNGVYEELRSFFSERAGLRGWLHSRYAYDVLLLILGFPASFALVYRVDAWLRPAARLPNALVVAIYVYLVLIALFFFRILFNYSKWVLPMLEGPSIEQKGPRLHKAILILVGTTLFGLVIESLLRMGGFFLF